MTETLITLREFSLTINHGYDWVGIQIKRHGQHLPTFGTTRIGKTQARLFKKADLDRFFLAFPSVRFISDTSQKDTRRRAPPKDDEYDRPPPAEFPPGPVPVYHWNTNASKIKAYLLTRKPPWEYNAFPYRRIT